MEFITFLGPIFGIKVPATWLKASVGDYQVLFTSPPMPDGRRATFGIFLEPVPKQQDIETSATEISARQPGDKPHNITQVLTAISTPKGLEGYQLSYVLQSANPPIFQQQTYFRDPRHSLVHLLIASRPADLEQKNSQLLDQLFDEMVSSYQFESPIFDPAQIET